MTYCFHKTRAQLHVGHQESHQYVDSRTGSHLHRLVTTLTRTTFLVEICHLFLEGEKVRVRQLNVLYQTRKNLFTIHVCLPSRTQERVENMTRSGVLSSTTFEVFGSVAKHCLEYLILSSLSKLTLKRKLRNKIIKLYAN